MTPPSTATFRKEERLCGKTSVSALLDSGRWGSIVHFKYCWAVTREEGPVRVLISVPKKFFKRAVKRNLLKRRVREAYRTRKALLSCEGVDLLFSYSSKECADFATVCSEVETILVRISRSLAK